MDPILEAECLVAVLGVAHALAKSPKAPTIAELHRAGKLPDVIPKRIKALFDLTKPKTQEAPAELPDFRETGAALSKGIDQDALTEMLLPVPPELHTACATVWSRCVQHLNGVFPRRVEMLMTGPKLHDPSRGDWAEFGWAWRLSHDPLSILDRVGEGMVIGAEVKHLQAMFPAIFAAIAGAIGDGLAEKVAEDDEWSPPWWLQKQLCTLLGVNPVSKTLLDDIEGAVQASKQQREQRAHDVQMHADQATPTQKLAGK
jgi:hypothetical protein